MVVGIKILKIVSYGFGHIRNLYIIGKNGIHVCEQTCCTIDILISDYDKLTR